MNTLQNATWQPDSFTWRMRWKLKWFRLLPKIVKICTLKICGCPFILHNTPWLNLICVKCTVMPLADTFSVSQLTRKCTYHVGGKRLAERLQHHTHTHSVRQLHNPLEWALNFGGWRICSIKVQRPPTRTEMTIAFKSGHFLWAYAPLKPLF